MKKHSLWLLLLPLLFFSSCFGTDDDDLTVDIDKYPLLLTIQGFQNPQFRTYTDSGEIVEEGLAFNNDPFFNNKAFLFDRIAFSAADNAALIVADTSQAAQDFNILFGNMDVEYAAADSIIFTHADPAENYEFVMLGTRELLTTGFQMTKLKRFDSGDPTAYGSFPQSVSVQNLINDLELNDTISILTYDLVYQAQPN